MHLGGLNDNMIHYMKLNNVPYCKIEDGSKTIEIRLYDEKRALIKIGDTIVFTHINDKSRTLTVNVVALHKYSSFREMYTNIPFSKFGLNDYSLDDMLDMTYEIYSKEKETKHSVLGIEIQLNEVK